MVWQMTAPLITKYRPKTFDEVVGHAAAVKALQSAIKKGAARAFLFTGPSGTGKTTLARIVAKEAGCSPANLIEVDAATNTGIDAMRDVTADLGYQALGGGVKGIIVDEAHALSKAASQSLLKILEEPPEWVYWFLCTTEATRILPTLRTRCLQIDLKPVDKRDLLTLLEDVAADEKMKPAKGVLSLCASEANGSPRQALAYLAACGEAEDLEEAQELLGSAEGSGEAVDLARLLVRGGKWAEAQELLKKLKDVDAESTRRVVQAYLTTVILSAKREDEAGRLLEKMDHFSQPFYQHAGLVMATGKALLS
jgi:DNA polymerase-3 subunit gamma/tau